MDNCLVLKGKLDLHGHGALNQSSSKRLSFLLFTLLICLGLPGTGNLTTDQPIHLSLKIHYPARALRALGLLLADGAPTVGGGKTF